MKLIPVIVAATLLSLAPSTAAGPVEATDCDDRDPQAVASDGCGATLIGVSASQDSDASGETYRNVSVGDLDGDGAPDLAASCRSGKGNVDQAINALRQASCYAGGGGGSGGADMRSFDAFLELNGTAELSGPLSVEHSGLPPGHANRVEWDLDNDGIADVSAQEGDGWVWVSYRNTTRPAFFDVFAELPTRGHGTGGSMSAYDGAARTGISTWTWTQTDGPFSAGVFVFGEGKATGCYAYGGGGSTPAAECIL